MLKKEICYLLLTRIQLDQEEQLGELYRQLKRKSNKKAQRTLDSLDPTRQRLKANWIDIAMRSLILLKTNFLLRQAMLRLKCFITKWKEIILDISLNILLGLRIRKLKIMLKKLIKVQLKELKKILRQLIQLDLV